MATSTTVPAATGEPTTINAAARTAEMQVTTSLPGRRSSVGAGVGPTHAGSAAISSAGGSNAEFISSPNCGYIDSGRGGSDSKLTVEIRTKSVEQTLVPLVTQV